MMKMFPLKLRIVQDLCFALLILFSVSACQAAAPLSGVTIMLDPGHGGSDPGAIGPTGLKESVTNLRVAKYLGLLLKADGAEVFFTRDSDTFLSLQERTDAALKVRPDLFVSIHHNASLRPKPVNRGEIYFNALDRGTPLSIANQMNRHLGNSYLASSSSVIPGGFYVLRNNAVPAVLTEASYISDPDNEKALNLGRTLTDEALIFRKAIRDVFSVPPLRIEFFTKHPCRTSTPFFNLLISANKSISRLELDIQGPGKTGFKLDRLPTYGNMYSLLNLNPLPTGVYNLSFSFYGEGGVVSSNHKLKLEVQLPIQNSVLLPVAPYIPKGFKGKFPLRLVLKDAQDKVNRVAMPFQIEWNGKTNSGVTQENGQACAFIDLDGFEGDSVKASILIDGATIAQTEIPVIENQRTFILGQIVNSTTGEGLEKAKVQYGPKRLTITGPGGYFFCELPVMFRNLSVQVTPPLGFSKGNQTIRTGGESIVQTKIPLTPVAAFLMKKHIAFLVEEEIPDQSVRAFVRGIMQRGATLTRLNLGKEAPKQASAVAKANALENLNLLISLKTEPKGIILRHYYKSTTGKALSEKIARVLKEWKFPVTVEGGSDYELGHSGCSALVIVFPQGKSVEYLCHAFEGILVALEQGW